MGSGCESAASAEASAVAYGKSCDVGGMIYPDGSTQITAPDGCNTCSCSDGTLVCTRRACAEPITCGAQFGASCADDAYCAYEGAGSCGAADESSICKPRPLSCPRIFDPVCACNGETFDNACLAAQAGFGYSNKGACNGPQRPRQSCTIDGVSYADGTTGIPASDGCNTCVCRDGVGCCTNTVCPAPICVVNGQIYADGSTDVPDPASCNRCRCSGGKLTDCTETDCPLPAPCAVGGAQYQHGFGFVTSDGTTSCQCTNGRMECAAAR